MLRITFVAASLTLGACGVAASGTAPLATDGPVTTVPFPGLTGTAPAVRPARPAATPYPAPPNAIAEVTRLQWLTDQLTQIRGWRIGQRGAAAEPAVVGEREASAMRSAASAWIQDCRGDARCAESRMFRLLRGLTGGIDGSGWGGTYAGPHWSMTILPAQYVDEVNALLTMDPAYAGAHPCSIALTGLHIDLEDRFPLPDPRDGAISGRDRLVLVDPQNPASMIRMTRVGDRVWIHRQGDTATLSHLCRAGGIFGEYVRTDAPKAVVSYLGAPGLLPLPPHIMMPGD